MTGIEGISPGWYTNMGITEFTNNNPDMEYPNICFNYILHNPVKDGLVKRPEDWEFPSYSDYIGIRKGNLINRNNSGIWASDSIRALSPSATLSRART